MHLRPPPNGSIDSSWDLSSARHDEGIVYVLCGRSAEYVGSTQACRFGPRRAPRRIGGTLSRLFEHLDELRMGWPKPELGLKRKVITAGDYPRSLETLLGSRPCFGTCHDPNTGSCLQFSRPPRERTATASTTATTAARTTSCSPPSDNLRQSAPLDSLGVSLEKEFIRWRTCRSRWPRGQQLRDLSSGFRRFCKQLLDTRLAGLGPSPIAMTVNLALSTAQPRRHV